MCRLRWNRRSREGVERLERGGGARRDAHPTMVIEIADAALACGAVVSLAVVGAPDEAADAEDAPILIHVPHPSEAHPVAKLLSDQLWLWEAVLRGALDRARVAPHETDEAGDRDRRLQVNGAHPYLHDQCELHAFGRDVRLHRGDEEEDQEEHERVATGRLAAHLAEVLIWQGRQIVHILPRGAVGRADWERLDVAATPDEPRLLGAATPLAAGGAARACHWWCHHAHLRMRGGAHARLDFLHRPRAADDEGKGRGDA